MPSFKMIQIIELLFILIYSLFKLLTFNNQKILGQRDSGQRMLKSLMTKIKSQKSDTLSSSKQKQKSPQNTLQKQQATTYQQLRQDIQINSQIKRIRYYAFDSYPNLYNKIVACPISTFNTLPYARRKVKQIDLTKDKIPQYIYPLKAILAKQLPNFNHLLINIYSPGVGIMPHFDGPLYKSKVVVLSLGGPAIISFTDSYKNINKCSQLLLEDQSIHVFQQQAYTKYLHGIESFTVDSVFLKAQRVSNKKGSQIIQSSVSNFHLTRISKVIQTYLSNLTEDISQQTDLSKEVGFNCSLICVKQNEEYNYKIQFVRQQRVSVTIRERLGLQSDPL